MNILGFCLFSLALTVFSVWNVECSVALRTFVNGNGAEFPRENDTVVVHYTGSLVDGQVFDSSRTQGREPFEFVIGKGNVINGWDVGIQYMSLGQRSQIIITYEDGYGSTGMMESTPPIYPFATLLFDVELLQIKKPQQQTAPSGLLGTFSQGQQQGQQQGSFDAQQGSQNQQQSNIGSASQTQQGFAPGQNQAQSGFGAAAQAMLRQRQAAAWRQQRWRPRLPGLWG